MKYILKHMDLPLVIFTGESGANPRIKIEWVNRDKKSLLPLDMENINEENLFSWIKHRSVPKNRAYVDNLLNTMGLSINRPLDIIRVSNGLSLNDCYWVVEENNQEKFANTNLYDNRFSRILGEIAFTGYGSSKQLIISSPEFTTNGMLPKCWRREEGVIRLYKGATSGFSNSGYEPYSEYYAAELGKYLGFNIVDYNVVKWKNNLCSTCELFTSKKYAYMPVGRLITTGGFETVYKYYEKLGNKYLDALKEMLIFDALIFNTDRHFGNFGFLVDNKTNKIVAPAPLFDHGNSLLSLISLDKLKDEKAVIKYADNLLPCTYDNFVLEAKKSMDNKMRKKVRSLLEFKFKKHPRYNLDNNRLKMIETAIHHRAKQLLED